MPLFTALDRPKADLDALRPLAPDAEQRLLPEQRLEWSYHTSALEGNALTLSEARDLLWHGLTAAGKPLRDHLALTAHHAAVRWLEDFVRHEGPLNEQLIRSMHKVLLGQPTGGPALPVGPGDRPPSRPGQYKTSSNNVLKDNGEVVYFSRPEDTPARMADLVAWYRHETAHPALHPVARAARLYHRFVRIHPFADGNSRLARLLLNLVLLRHGYGLRCLMSIHNQRPPIPPEVQARLANVWIPRAAAEARYSSCAVVEAVTPLGRLAARSLASNLITRLNYRHFVSEAEAEAETWLIAEATH